jgi:hypothetical protein|tara:strand:- start:24 stop:338 length:315 start_codon:yes stop_codon:yes gene_type:complete
MEFLKEDISRIKEVMGIDEEPNSPMYKGPEGYDDGCDCYPDDDEIDNIDDIDGEIDEQDDGDSAPSGPSMTTWETGVTRGKANPIDGTSTWDPGINRGKGNPLW